MLPTAGQFRKLGEEFLKKNEKLIYLSHKIKLYTELRTGSIVDPAGQKHTFEIPPCEDDALCQYPNQFSAYDVYCPPGGSYYGYFRNPQMLDGDNERTIVLEFWGLAKAAGKLLGKIPDHLISDAGAFCNLKREFFNFLLWCVFLHELEGNRLKENRPSVVEPVYLKSSLACEWLADRLEAAEQSKPLPSGSEADLASPLKTKTEKAKTPSSFDEDYRKDTYRRHGVSIPFPLEEIFYYTTDGTPDGVYDHDDPEFLERTSSAAYGAINDYLMFFYKPGLCLNKEQFNLAIGYAREIRGVYRILAEIPFAENPDNPTEQDFIRLGQWFLDAHTAITKDIAAYNAARTQLSKTDLPIPLKNFIKCGNVWEFCFDGKTVYVNGSLKGLPLIAYLLSNPGRPISAFDLESAVVKKPVGKNVGELSGDLHDQTDDIGSMAITATGQTINSRELAKADMQGLKEVIAKLETERDKMTRPSDKDEIDIKISVLQKEIDRKTNRHGKARPIAGDPYENARSRVIQAVNTVREKIKKDHKELYTHLDNCLKIATDCSYTPENHTNWQIS